MFSVRFLEARSPSLLSAWSQHPKFGVRRSSNFFKSHDSSHPSVKLNNTDAPPSPRPLKTLTLFHSHFILSALLFAPSGLQLLHFLSPTSHFQHLQLLSNTFGDLFSPRSAPHLPSITFTSPTLTAPPNAMPSPDSKPKSTQSSPVSRILRTTGPMLETVPF